MFLEKIDTLRKPLHNLNDSNKSKICEYMKNLLELAKSYN